MPKERQEKPPGVREEAEFRLQESAPDPVEEASMESFPASDPPAGNAGVKPQTSVRKAAARPLSRILDQKVSLSPN